MSNLITIDQLLDSVDLDFEPRWVTKDKEGYITIWSNRKPEIDEDMHKWLGLIHISCPKLKLSEFENKDWQECIYEVPRKTDEYEQNLEKLRPADSDLVYRVNLPRKTTGKIEPITLPVLVDEQIENPSSRDVWIHAIVDKIAELIDAVNELKGAKNE